MRWWSALVLFVISCGAASGPGAAAPPAVVATPAKPSVDCTTQLAVAAAPSTDPQQRATARRLITEAVQLGAADAAGAMDRLCRAFAIRPHPAVLVEMALLADATGRAERAAELRARAIELAGPTRSTIGPWLDPAEAAFGRNPRYLLARALYDLRTGTLHQRISEDHLRLSGDGSLVAGLRRLGFGDKQATAGSSGPAREELKVYDAVTHDDVAVIRGTDDAGVVAFDFLARDLVAVALRGGGLEIWDVVTNRLRNRIPRATEWTRVEASPDGTSLVVTGRNGDAGLVAAIAPGTGAVTWEQPIGPKVACLAFGPDGRRLVTCSTGATAADPEIIVWEAASGQRAIAGPLKLASCGGPSVALGPAGELAVHCADRVRVFDTKGAEILSARSRSNVRAIAFSADGRRLLLRANGIEVLDARTGALLREVKRWSEVEPRSALSPDRHHLAIAIGALVLVVPLTEGAPYVASRHKSGVRSLAFTTNGQLFSAGFDRDLAIHDLGSKTTRELPSPSESAVIAISPDGKQFVVVSDDTLEIRAVDGGARLAQAPSDALGAIKLAELRFSEDGTHVAGDSFSLGAEPSLLWVPASNKVVRFPDRILALSPDHRFVVYKDWPEWKDDYHDVIALHDLTSGQIRRLEVQGLQGAAFHAGGAVLTVYADYTNKLWDLAAGRIDAMQEVTGPLAFLERSSAPILIEDRLMMRTETRFSDHGDPEYKLIFGDGSPSGDPLASLELSGTGGWLVKTRDGASEIGGDTVVQLVTPTGLGLPLATRPPRGDGSLLRNALASAVPWSLAGGGASPGGAALGARAVPPVWLSDRNAKQLLNQLIRQSPGDSGDRTKAMALHRRALTAHADGTFTAASRIWAEAVQVDPSWDWPFYNLACVASLTGRFDDAIVYLREVLRREPAPDMLQRFQKDADLAGVRARPEFAPLLKQLSQDLAARRRAGSR